MAPDEDIGRQIDTLIEKLPRDAAGQILDCIEEEGGNGPRKDAVRQALVKRLNAQRSQHARRLFTAIFDPFLCRDPLFLRPELAPTGVIHALDLGAVWAWLAGGPMRALAGQCDSRLKEMAAHLPIDRALATGEAQAMRERLRAEAAAALTPVLDSAQTGQSLLTRLNEWRVAEARSAGLPAPRPLVRDDLVLIRGLLAGGGDVAALVERALDTLARRRAEPVESLVEQAAALPAVPVGAKSGQADIGRMVPLTLLNRHLAYDALPAFLSVAPASWREMLAAALARHLARAATALAEELSAIAAPGGVRGPLVALPARRTTLDRALGAMDGLLITAEEFGLLSSDRHGPVIRDHLGRMIKKVEADLYPALIERCVAACRSLARPTPDHEALDWLLDFAARWRRALTRNLHWGTGYTDFRGHVLEDLRDGFARSFTQPGYEQARDRLIHAARLAGFARRLEDDPAGWLSLLDKGLMQTATARLRDDTGVTEGEAALLRAVALLVDAELKRTRYWKSPELQEFAGLAAQRLMLAAS